MTKGNEVLPTSGGPSGSIVINSDGVRTDSLRSTTAVGCSESGSTGKEHLCTWVQVDTR